MSSTAVAPALDADSQIGPAYLIESLFHVNRIHLIVGSSGTGKTRLLLPMIDQWRQGQEVLGLRSHPLPFGYLLCDRPRAAAIETMRSLDIDPATIPLYSFMNKDDEFEMTPESIPAIFPKARVIFIESLAAMMRGKMNDYQEVFRFFRQLYLICEQHNLTIIGTCHSPKMKRGEEYLNIRDNVLGSSAWPACSDTICHLEYFDPSRIKDPTRKLTVMPHNSLSTVYTMAFDAKGRLLEAPVDESAWECALDLELSKLKFNEPFRTSLVLDWGSCHNVPQRTVERWIAMSEQNGKIERIRRGMYRRPFTT